MKKIMFILALFMSVGLFADARNGKIKIDTKPTIWQVVYSGCGQTYTHVVCCFATYSAALDYMMDHDIPCSQF